MYMKNNQPVNEYSSPCVNCSEYLNNYMPIVVDGFICGECDLSYCEWCSCYDDCMNGVLNMKLLNYDSKYLIMQNLRPVTKIVPGHYAESSYKILCRLIRQKRISKQFFDFLLAESYQLQDWKQLTYEEMYQLIHILTYLDYEKVRV